MKALYLDGRAGIHVGLDGPALRVRRPGRAAGRYPLPRVARVISVGAVHWRGDALNTCLREHKPVVVLDNRGRFVRLLFRPPEAPHGPAHHMEDLLAVPRFQQRYLHWQRNTQKTEMLEAVRALRFPCRLLQPEKVWQMICLEQYRRWSLRTGSYYGYLLGAAAAHIACTLARLGMPRNPKFWGREEYRFFCHLVRLERWRLAVLLEELLSTDGGRPDRRRLTVALETMAPDRQSRIDTWRRRALVAMTGVPLEEATSREPRPAKPLPGDLHRALLWFCQGEPHCASQSRRPAPIQERAPLEQSVRILRRHLVCDRRRHESYRTA